MTSGEVGKPSLNRKKLIEVALPLSAINAAAVAEKDVHTGHPANLHTWWARRPLATARAILFASIVDDPAHEGSVEGGREARQRLFKLIEKLCTWESTNQKDLVARAKAEILASTGGRLPRVYDPFCGGGAIPIEAQRLGLSALASDLNPVAVLVTKAMIDVIPKVQNRPPVHPGVKIQTGKTWRGVTGIVEDLQFYGDWILKAAWKRIGAHFPQGPRDATIVAWLWARTVTCPNPACGLTIPLLQSTSLSTHTSNEAHLKLAVDTRTRRIQFEVVRRAADSPGGTVNRRGAVCPRCKTSVNFDYISGEGAAGRMGFQLTSYVVDPGARRLYLKPDEEQEQSAIAVTPGWRPETDLPDKALGFRVQRYGIRKHADLFTPRQLLAVATFSDLVSEAYQEILAASGDDEEYSKAIALLLAFCVDRLAQTNNTLVRWLIRKSGTSKGTPAFDRQIVSMIWNFAEGNVFGESVGSWRMAVNNVKSAIGSVPPEAVPGEVFQADARLSPDFEGPIVVCTDPPYFANVGFSDLSDFYYVWLRRTLGRILPEFFSTVLVPKDQELVANPHRFGDDGALAEANFLHGMTAAFQRLRKIAGDEYPLTVYYAFKESMGPENEERDESSEESGSPAWEKMLGALIMAGLCIVATWPMRTEQRKRMRAIQSNALASSIVLVCRPRPPDAPLATRREFLSALRKEMPGALKRLQEGNIAPVDLAQAAIGPGMAIFSGYSRVLEPDGSAMTVRTALQIINQELDAHLKESDVESDSETLFCIAWFDQYGLGPGPFGEAEVLAKAKNARVDHLARSGVVSSKGGKVLLSALSDYLPEWEPTSDVRISLWECTHHLIKRLQVGGEQAAAALVARIGPGRGEDAKNLAYRLYTICERKGWAEEALAYNEFVVAWPEVLKNAAFIMGEGPQKTLDMEEKV